MGVTGPMKEATSSWWIALVDKRYKEPEKKMMPRLKNRCASLVSFVWSLMLDTNNKAKT